MGNKSEAFQNCHHYSRSSDTYERKHIVSFPFHCTASYKFDLFKTVTKLQCKRTSVCLRACWRKSEDKSNVYFRSLKLQ